MFAPDTNTLYTNLTQGKGDYKTLFYLSRNAYLMLKTNYYDQRILKSEHPSGHNPPTHPNPSVVRILKSVEKNGRSLIWINSKVKNPIHIY